MPPEIQALLRELHQAGVVRVSPREARAVAEVLAAGLVAGGRVHGVPRETTAGLDRGALGAALAAILASNPEEYAAVEAYVRTWVCEPPPVGLPPGMGSRVRRVLAGVPARTLLLVGVAAVLGLALLWLGGVFEEAKEVNEATPIAMPEVAPPPPPPSERWTFTEAVPETRVPTSVRPEGLPGPWWALVASVGTSAALAFGGVTLLVYAVTAGSTRRQEEAQATRLRAEAARRDTGQGVPYEVPVFPLFEPGHADEAAALLSRRAGGPTDHLDIDGTIHRRARAPTRMDVVWARGRAADPVIVLLDVEAGDSPWRAPVERLLAHWRRGGLRLDVYTFQHRAREVTPMNGGPAIPLERLTRRTEGACALLFSALRLPLDMGNQMPWAPPLTRWRTAWIDLDPRPPADHPREKRRAAWHLGKAGARRFVATAEGLVAAAAWLVEAGRGRIPREPDLRPPVDPEGLRLWAAVAACVPDPTWAQLEVLRRSLPELTERVEDPRRIVDLIELVTVDWEASREGGSAVVSNGRRLTMRRELERTLLDELRAFDRRSGRHAEETLEQRARRILLSQLQAATVPEATLQHARWRLKVAQHQLVLGEADVYTFIAQFRGSETEVEAREWLAGEMKRREAVAATVAEGEAVRSWVGGEGVALGAPPPSRARTWLILGGLAVAAWLGLVWSGVAILGRWLIPTDGTRIQPAVTQVEDSTKRFGALDDPPTGTAAPSPDPPALAGVAPMAFVRLSGGEFTMGSPDDEPGHQEDEGPRHRVRVSTFEIAVTEVTQRQYREVTGQAPSDCDYGCGDDYPVQRVSWLDAARFLNTLSEKEGRTRCYTIEGDTVTWEDPHCSGYRLPTEAEWEYAARAGTTTAWSFGDDAEKADPYAWTSSNAENTTRPVGTSAENPWGLWDMHGNVWEWGWDGYSSYTSLSLSDPSGTGTGDRRVLRGGSFADSAVNIRSSFRGRYYPSRSLGVLGFRCVRGAAPSR